MRICLFIMGLAATFACWQDSVQGGGAKSDFFNGTDLTGWVGLGDYWSVKDGAIVGSAPKGLKFNTFLCSKKPYRDFELKFQVKLTGANPNSGVQIRSAVFNLETLAVMGPQCDMGQIYWGSLYGEHYGGMMKAAPKELVAKMLKPDDFNDYSIRCVGTRVTIKFNGETTVDGDFKMPAEGLIGWQLHSGGPMEVVFRKIEFTEIKTEKKKKAAVQVYPVTGTVTLNGKPLAGAAIAWHPVGSQTAPASGTTGNDGTFNLTTYQKNDGAAPGKYKVTISFPKDGKEMLPNFSDPAKTPLIAEVVKGDRNIFGFKIGVK
jgi:hypothetical protein